MDALAAFPRGGWGDGVEPCPSLIVLSVETTGIALNSQAWVILLPTRWLVQILSKGANHAIGQRVIPKLGSAYGARISHST
ncbi:hypothetical protein ACH4GE_42350 [Streptomyces tendae]|uniref:hypothetical protein n=1 Tax=Streptomyces tendae TaxID=1932 RepID=UPI0037B97B6C